MNGSDLLFNNHLAQTTPFPLGIKVKSAFGSIITSEDGREYIDLISGLAVNNIGHSHPKVVAAIKEQIDRHMHVMVYGEFEQESQNRAAKALTHFLPESLDTVYFVNSGTEAIEAALKLAKRVTHRSKILSFKGAYHGNTHGSMSVSYNEVKKSVFRPLLPQIDFLRLNDVSDLEFINHETACVILETVQGDAGIRIPDGNFMKLLREKCTATGTLLILDEIQAGIGRTGTFCAFEHFDIVPDILVLGKALGGGLPVGAFVASKEHMIQLTEKPMLGHITTFGGHPVVCAAVAANLEVMKTEIDYDHVNSMSQLTIDTLSIHEKVLDVRAVGLFIAVELKNPEEVQKVVTQCIEKGVLLFWFLSCQNAFRMAPPLNITELELSKGLSVIKSALDDLR